MKVAAILVLGAAASLNVAAVREAMNRRLMAIPRLRQRLMDVPFGCGRLRHPASDHRNNGLLTPGRPPGAGASLPCYVPVWVRMKIGRCRVVFSWYLAKAGYAATYCCHRISYSAPVTSIVVTEKVCAPISTTAAG